MCKDKERIFRRKLRIRNGYAIVPHLMLLQPKRQAEGADTSGPPFPRSERRSLKLAGAGQTLYKCSSAIADSVNLAQQRKGLGK